MRLIAANSNSRVLICLRVFGVIVETLLGVAIFAWVRLRRSKSFKLKFADGIFVDAVCGRYTDAFLIGRLGVNEAPGLGERMRWHC